MATSAPPQLPSDADLDLIDYKIGSALSDLDGFRTLVEKAVAGDIETVEEYEKRKAAGTLGDKPEFDRTQVARIIVWALDWLDDARKIGEDAEALLHGARILYQEGGTRADGALHWQRAADWHREALEDRGQ